MGKSIFEKIGTVVKRRHLNIRIWMIGYRYPNIRKWLKAMKLNPKNKMVRHSFIREYVFRNFDILKFCEDFDLYLKDNAEQIKHQPSKLYKVFIIETYVKTKRLLNGPSIEKLPDKVCHYLPAYKFYHSIMNNGDESRGFLDRANLKKERPFRLMIANKLTPDDISYWEGEFKGDTDIIWFTKCSSIPDGFRESSDNPEAARVIRNLLGLAHLYQDGLIEVQIPKSKVENGSKVPTICESVGYPYFRPAKRIDGFGRAIDLDKKSTGLPEGVHAKISWDKDFNIRYVGDLPMEKKFSDLEWLQVTDTSETDLIAFMKGEKNEA